MDKRYVEEIQKWKKVYLTSVVNIALGFRSSQVG